MMKKSIKSFKILLNSGFVRDGLKKEDIKVKDQSI